VTRRNTRIGTGLARLLGWFSIGLGAVEVLAPRTITRPLGLRGKERLVRAYGAREIVIGAGILSASDPAPWLWGRVAGDGVDMATVAPAALSSRNPRRESAGLALAAIAGIAVVDGLCAAVLSARPQPRERPPVPRARPLSYFRARSGWRLPASAMRGAARDFVVPEDFRPPEALRPYPPGRPPGEA
jgi:hypothetical protein